MSEADDAVLRGAPRPVERIGAALFLGAVLVVVITSTVTATSAGTAYVWHLNMLSDLGDRTCAVRGERWVCSPTFATFNAGLVASGVLTAAAAACLVRPWGRGLAASVTVMGAGLVVLGSHPADVAPGVHLVAVVLALVVPGIGLLIAGIRPETAWLRRGRALRVALASASLAFCAEGRITPRIVPEGAGELLIVGFLVTALTLESARILLTRTAQMSTSRRAPIGP